MLPFKEDISSSKFYCVMLLLCIFVYMGNFNDSSYFISLSQVIILERGFTIYLECEHSFRTFYGCQESRGMAKSFFYNLFQPISLKKNNLKFVG